MSNFLRKYKGEMLLVINLLVFVMFTLVFPHLRFNHTFLNYLFGTLLSAPLITLLVFWFIKTKDKKGSFYNRFFNVLSIVNNFLFILTLKTVIEEETFSLFGLMKTVRAPLAIIYFIVFILGYLFNIFELILSLGFLDKVMPIRENIERENKKKSDPLVREARNKRIEEKVSSLRFLLLISAILSLLYFIVPLVSEMFTIPLGGDYTQQQIPFYTNGYDDWWRFLKTGEFPLWDHNTFLGADNIGSNSYYYTLNPFFLPILIFPRDLIPQGMAILMMAKLVLAVFSMRAYLKYMGVAEKEARFFAIMYAFCGWNTYNLWFNSFMEVVVILPLIFLGVEKILKEKKIMLLVFALGLMGIANYFFLMTMGLIAVIYAVFRYFQKLPKVDPSVIGYGILAFALGLLLSSIVLFPSLAVSLSSDRAVNATYLDTIIEAFSLKNWKLVWDLMTKWEARNPAITYRKFYPLISYYFPTLSDRSVALLNTSVYDNTASSIFSFSPIILLLIPALYNSIKEKKWSHLLAVAFFIFALFTPFFYNFFHGFTNEYGRWQLIVPFVLITYVALSLPKIKEQKPLAFDISLIVNLIIMAFTVKIAFSYENKSGFSYMYQREYIIFYQFVMFFVTYLLFRFTYKRKNNVYMQSILVFVEVIVMGAATMVGHGFISYKNSVTGGLESYRADEKVAQKIGSIDESFYRIFNARVGRGNENLPERAGYNGLSTFHSLYNFELMEFNEWSNLNVNLHDVERNPGWSLTVFEKRGMLYDFLAVKYFVFNSGDNAVWINNVRYNAPYKNVPNTYERRDDLNTNNRFVYKVKETFDVGFGVDYAVTYEEDNGTDTFTNLITKDSGLSPLKVEEMYLKSAILNYRDLKEVLKEVPHLGTQSFLEVQATNSYITNSNQTINRKFYEYESNNRYPFEAQLGANKVLPTPEWVSANAKEITKPAKIIRNKHVIEYTRNDGKNIIGENGGEIILNLQLTNNYRYRAFLYDENYELITIEDHGQGTTGTSNWKMLRSYHSPVAVKKITLVPFIDEAYFPNTTNLYIYNQSAIDNVRQTMIDNSLQDVVTKTNTITFKTDYATEKFVVTTIPYDPGWAVEVIGEETKTAKSVYKVQGGFVGFVSEKGPAEYKMSFTPRYFNLGAVISLASLLITLLLSLNMYAYRTYKKKKAMLEEVLLSKEENKNIIIR